MTPNSTPTKDSAELRDSGFVYKKDGYTVPIIAVYNSLTALQQKALDAAVSAQVAAANKPDQEYTKELEKIVIFLCDVYAKGQDSLTCQTDDSGQVDEKWMDIFMAFPTIQGGINRAFAQRIGNLRTRLSNRESVKLSFKELFEKLKVGRKETNIPAHLTTEQKDKS